MNDNEKVIKVLEQTRGQQERYLQNALASIAELEEELEAEALQVFAARGLIAAIDKALDDLRAKVAAESGGVYFTPPDEHIPDEPEEVDYDPFETTSSEEPKDRARTFATGGIIPLPTQGPSGVL